ncbi:MAG: ABC transporter substrate-binding protein [Motiliproteus sp.]
MLSNPLLQVFSEWCRQVSSAACRRQLIALLLVLTSLSGPLFAHHQTLRIGVFTSRSVDDAFWGPVEQFMQAACDDLGIELHVFYADGDHIALIRQFETAVRSVPRFDALVLPNFKQTAHRNIKTAQDHQTPVLLFNSGLSAEHEAEMGKPRQRYHYWIGSILPDEQQAGADLLAWLLSKAQAINPAGVALAPLLAVGGNLADFASIQRTLGMEQALARHRELRLGQLVHADWRRQLAATMFGRLVKRYPADSAGSRIVWAASDLMALGVLDGAEQAQVSVITGGVDWTAEGLTSVLNGGLEVSFGGHFMDGGWAAVMLYDYFHGVDFADQSLSFVTTMVPLSIDDKDLVNQLLDSQGWQQVDFRRFSKVFSPSIKRYPFTPEAVFSQLH